MVLPVALTSVSCWPNVVLVNVTEAFCTAMNFSVCVLLCALATAGSTSAPVVPRATAAPAAMMDVRIFMVSPPCPLNLCCSGRLRVDALVAVLVDAGKQRGHVLGG